MSSLPRIQSLVIPILRDAFPEVHVGSWFEDIDFRTFPILNVRRIGGTRYEGGPTVFSQPTIELTAYTEVDLPTTETLYEDALDALYAAVYSQEPLVGVGYLHSIKETFGATQFSSLFQDSWRVQGLIQFGIRRPRPDPVQPVPWQHRPETFSNLERKAE